MVCCVAGNPESCGEQCDRYCPCISPYPNLCTAFLSLVIAAIITTIFAAYAYISLRVSIFRFNWSTTWLIFVNSALLALILVVILLLLSLALWFVCSSHRRGLVYKAFYLVMLFVSVLGLAAVMVGSILIIYGANGKKTAFAKELEVVWMDQVNNGNSTLPCRVQKQLACRGFERDDCRKGAPTQNFTRCGVTCRPEDEEGGRAELTILEFPGCREKISTFYTTWNAVLLAGTTLACILSLIALFVTCTSVSFEADR